MIIQKVREWKCNKIFLATEDKTIVQFFKDTLGDGFGTFCVTLDREYADYKPGKWINDVSLYVETDLVSMTKAYITEMIILSKCTSFIAAKCSGATGVMMLSEGFENTYAFDLGVYGVRPVDWRKLIGQ